MPVIEIHLGISEDQQEIFSAIFIEDFEAFRMEGDEMWAYLPEGNWGDDLRNRVLTWLSEENRGRIIEVDSIQDRNWNDEWEKSIKAIEAGGFIVHPSWAPVDRDDLEAIVIDPKMSFGTGHHETTRLMLGLIRDCATRNMFLLDAGTGTGVLGIAAVKLGAANVVAYDIDPLCRINGEENREINGIEKGQLEFRTGEFSQIIVEKDFDAIYANINKNALVSLLGGFNRVLSKEGYLLVSGLLHTDKEDFLGEADQCGFRVLKVVRENEWIAIHLCKI